MRRLFKGLLWSLGSLLLILALGLGGILGTQLGSQWLLEHIPGLSVTQFQGRLGGQWQAQQLHWANATQRITAQHLAFDWQPACLWRARLCITLLDADELTLTLPASDPAAPPDTSPWVLPHFPIPLALQWDRLQINHLTLNDQPLVQHLQLTGRLDTQADWPVQLDGNGRLLIPNQPALDWVLGVRGTLQQQLELHLDTQGYWTGQIRGQLHALNPLLPLAVQLRSEAFQPSGLPEALQLQHLALEARGDLQAGYQISGEAQLGAKQEIAVQWEALIHSQTAQLKQLTFTSAPNRYIRLSGQADWQRELQLQTHLDWHDFPWQNFYPAATTPIHIPQLTAQFTYQNQTYQGQLAADLRGPAGPFHLNTAIQGNTTTLRLPQLELIAGAGRIQGSVQLDWAQDLNWLAKLELAAFNPAYWIAELPGRLEGHLHTEGKIHQHLPEGSVTSTLTGQLRQAPTRITLNVRTQNQDWYLDELDVRLGENRLYGQGQWAKTLSGQGVIQFNKLAQLWPGLRGQAKGQWHIAGTLEQPQGTLDLKAQGLAYQNQQIRQLTLSAHLSAQQQGKLELHAQHLIANKTDFGQLRFRLEGNPQYHQAQLQVQGAPLEANFKLQGRFSDANWRGHIVSADVTGAGQHWILDQTTDLEYLAHNRLNLAAHCWSFQAAHLCANAQRLWPNPQLNYRLSHFPVESLAAWFPESMQWQAKLNAELSLELPTSGPTGLIHMEAGPGVLRVREGKNWQSLPYQVLTLDTQLKPNQADFTLDLQGQSLGHFNVQAQIDPRKSHKPLTGHFRLNALDLEIARPFLSQVDHLKGQLNGDGQLSGSLQQPRINGQIRLTEGWISGQQLPTALEHIQLQVDISGEQLLLNGQWRSGAQGVGHLNGRLNWSGPLDLEATLKGQQWPVVLEPYASVQVSPDLAIQLKNTQLRIQGLIAIPEGTISVHELPPSTVRVSSDAIIVGPQAETAPPSPSMPLNMAMDIQVIAGQKQLSFSGFGVQSQLVGQLHLGDNLDTRGELKLINGRYKAYGQRLTLRRARILFTGPINEPFLDIEAIRRIETDNVSAGLKISGSVAQPKVEVFGEPSMGQEQALSYLVMGRALGSQSGDSNVLARAALGLGLSGSAPLTSALANQLGIQDFQLDTEGTGTATNLVATGRVTDRLSLRYGVGIFESSNTITLRYRLTQKLFLEAASGLSSSLDVFYRRDF